MYPFKVLNKKKYALCFINVFLENMCLYIMPVILSIFLTVPFTLNKFKSADNQIEKIIVEEEQQNKIRSWNNITIKDVEFKYNDESKTTIKIPNFSLNKKDKVSIIGESGQGKSTFLSLFCRFYNIEDKNYLTDNTPTSKAPDIAYISQKTDLLLHTIEDTEYQINTSNEIINLIQTLKVKERNKNAKK